jgi:HK97 family phage major capsid protein
MAVSAKPKTAAEKLAEAKILEDAAAVLKARGETPASRARPLTPAEAAAERVPAEARDAEAEGQWGFKCFRHFLDEVKVSPNKNTPSETIKKAYESETVKKAALGMGELVGSDGGFLVPPTFAQKIFERVYDENNILGKSDQYPVSGNSMVFPRTAETSRADGSRWGGVRSYWVQEGSTITDSHPTFGRLTLNLHKLATLVALTSELKADAGPAMESYVNKVFASEIGFETGKAVYRGNGVGRPLGILNAPCAVTVSAEAGQAAATITSQNIVKMWARRFALGPTGQYVWFINQDVGPQLHLLTLGIGTAGVATYLPPGGLSSSPYGTLMGAPVVEIEWASTLGTVGDICLADMSQYVSITGAGGPVTLSSMHVYFTTDQEAVRTTWRVDGAPWWPAALTPYQGTNTQSPFIFLATR